MFVFVLYTSYDIYLLISYINVNYYLCLIYRDVQCTKVEVDPRASKIIRMQFFI